MQLIKLYLKPTTIIKMSPQLLSRSYDIGQCPFVRDVPGSTGGLRSPGFSVLITPPVNGTFTYHVNGKTGENKIWFRVLSSHDDGDVLHITLSVTQILLKGTAHSDLGHAMLHELLQADGWQFVNPHPYF